MTERICDWSELAEGGWKTLLVGNGASIAIWELFCYSSLFERACELDDGGLEAPEKGLFEQDETDNFEGVLLALRSGERVADLLRVETAPFKLSYGRVKRSLAAALRSVHIVRGDVPEGVLQKVRDALSVYDSVFSLNYDLLIYWSIASDEARRFPDCFFSADHWFNPADTTVLGGRTRVLFLHGGIHLETPDGVRVKKRVVADVGSLLDAFGEDAAGDGVPLVVTEGRWQDKLKVIRQSEYLRFAFEEFRDAPQPVVLFGTSLETDGHLVEVVKSWGDVRLAVSVFGQDDAQRIAYCGRIRSLFPNACLVFYDATTHPLGTSDLRVPLDVDERIAVQGGVAAIVPTVQQRVEQLVGRAEGLREAINEKHYEYMMYESAGVAEEYLPYIQLDINTLGWELSQVEASLAEFGVFLDGD